MNTTRKVLALSLLVSVSVCMQAGAMDVDVKDVIETVDRAGNAAKTTTEVADQPTMPSSNQVVTFDTVVLSPSEQITEKQEPPAHEQKDKEPSVAPQNNESNLASGEETQDKSEKTESVDGLTQSKQTQPDTSVDTTGGLTAGIKTDKPVSRISRMRTVVAAQASKTKNFMTAGAGQVKKAFVTAKHYTIDPVTALAMRVMLGARDKWNGYTPAKLEAIRKMDGAAIAQCVTNKSFSDTKYEALRELVCKVDWTRDDYQDALKKLAQLKPSLLRKAVNGAKTFMRVISLGYICQRDKEADKVVLATTLRVAKTNLQSVQAACEKLNDLQGQIKATEEQKRGLLKEAVTVQKDASLLKPAERVLSKAERKAAAATLLS